MTIIIQFVARFSLVWAVVASQPLPEECGYSARSVESAPPCAKDQFWPTFDLLEWADAEAGPARSMTSIQLRIRSRGRTQLTVFTGQLVQYEAVAELSNDKSKGLALIGFSLHFEGGPLPYADMPKGELRDCDNPMIHFIRPWGITNPGGVCPPSCGFNGTSIGGDLIQIGGGQNTINNTPDHAAFPIGPVLLGVGLPSGCGPVLVISGQVTAPSEPGIYQLVPYDVFANVIRETATGVPFWPTEAAAVGTLEPLTLIVEPPSVSIQATGATRHDQDRPVRPVDTRDHP